MSQTEVKVRCPLVWEYDGSGEWSAISQVMDPEMTDEPVETWCREWALMWRIHVTEEGQFCLDQSDSVLLGTTYIHQPCYSTLDQLKSFIDRAEGEAREMTTFGSGKQVHLLPASIYNKRRSL